LPVQPLSVGEPSGMVMPQGQVEDLLRFDHPPVRCIVAHEPRR
jgi:hypothetical protein